MYIYEGCTREEIQAYRELQNEHFDFGTGLIVPENGGEEAYYEMALESSEWDYLLDGFDNYGNRYEDVDYSKDMTRAKRRKKNWNYSLKRRFNCGVIDYDRFFRYVDNSDYLERSEGWFYAIGKLKKDKSLRKSNRELYEIKEKGKKRFIVPRDKKKIDYCNYSLEEYQNNKSYNYWDLYHYHDAEIETKIQLDREQDELIFDYICNTDDNVLILYDGTIRYKEKSEDWVKRNYRGMNAEYYGIY